MRTSKVFPELSRRTQGPADRRDARRRRATVSVKYRHFADNRQPAVGFARFPRYMLRYGLEITMRLTRQNMLTGRRYLRRGVSLILLFLIFTDLALPQVCCDELNCESGVGSAAYSADSGEKEVLANPLDDHRDQHPETPSPKSGCFCCCAHVLLSSAQNADVAIVKRTPVALSAHFLPTSPPKDQFHPPRSA